MTANSIPKKLVALSDFPLKQSKFRLFFIVSDGGKNLEHIANQCKLSLDEAKQIADSLVTGGYVELLSGGPVEEPVQVKNPMVREISIPEDFWTQLSELFASYMGPVAPLLIKRICKKDEIVSRKQLTEALRLLSEEIDNQDDQTRFYEQMNSLADKVL